MSDYKKRQESVLDNPKCLGNDLSLTSLNHQQEKIDNLLAAIKVLKEACEKVIDHSEVESEGATKHEYGFVKIADIALNSPELEAIKELLDE